MNKTFTIGVEIIPIQVKVYPGEIKLHKVLPFVKNEKAEMESAFYLDKEKNCNI